MKLVNLNWRFVLIIIASCLFAFGCYSIYWFYRYNHLKVITDAEYTDYIFDSIIPNHEGYFRGNYESAWVNFREINKTIIPVCFGTIFLSFIILFFAFRIKTKKIELVIKLNETHILFITVLFITILFVIVFLFGLIFEIKTADSNLREILDILKKVKPLSK